MPIYDIPLDLRPTEDRADQGDKVDVIFPSTLKRWADEHKSNPKVATALSTWLEYMKVMSFKDPGTLRQGKFSPDVVRTESLAGVPSHLLRVVWNICGNEFRLVGHVGLQAQEVFLKGFYTHIEYDSVDLTKHRYG